MLMNCTNLLKHFKIQENDSPRFTLVTQEVFPCIYHKFSSENDHFTAVKSLYIASACSRMHSSCQKNYAQLVVNRASTLDK